MSDSAIDRSRLALPTAVGLEAVLLCLVGLAFALKLHLVFTIGVNWDEFYFLALVHDHLRGTLVNPLQTIHVHLFSWLPTVSESEVEQVVAARLVLLLLAVASCWLTYLIGRRFLSVAASLFAVLCYLAFSLSVEHQTSFRADPLGAFCFLAALACWFRLSDWRLSACCAGVAIAAAFLVTIKSAFFVPVFAALLLAELLSGDGWKRVFLRGALFSAGLIVTFAILYLAHRSTLSVADTIEGTRYLRSSGAKVLLWHDLFPRWPYLVRSLMEDAVVWLLLVAGIAVALAHLRGAEKGTVRGVVPLAIFLLPLASLAIYRNAFPYFYVFILSPAILLCGLAYDNLLGKFGRPLLSSSRLWLIGLTVAVAVSFAKHYVTNSDDRMVAQRETVDLVHALFPDPVPYIDRSSMISAYPKQGFFMSSWGLENYRAAGRPIFADVIRERRPLFLIVNSPSLDPNLDRDALAAAGGIPLLEEDAEVLRDNYLHHWGALYVTGKRLTFDDPGEERAFEILIPGVYTLEAAGALVIDGETFEPGALVRLSAGRHLARSGTAGPSEVRLRWGDHLRRPAKAPSDQPIFSGF